MFDYKGIGIAWLGHDGFLLQKGPLRVYIDPFKISHEAIRPASLVCITHEHFDHLSIEDLRKIVNERTTIVCSQECMSSLSKVEPGAVVIMKPGETKQVQGVTITAIPAYNTNKYRDPALKLTFHPAEDEKLGYLIDMGVKIYHVGDSDETPEIDRVACDVVLLPVSGTYVMTAEEAAGAAKKLKPKVTIPMHYGSIVGTESDAEKFKKLLAETDIKVEILKKL